MDMFCRQCEQAAKGTGCSAKRGVCGKTPEAAALQDVLVRLLEGIGFWGDLAGPLGARESGLDRFVAEALFTTVTNVNFDSGSLLEWIRQAQGRRESVREAFLAAYRKAHRTEFKGPVPERAAWTPEADPEGLLKQAAGIWPAASSGTEDLVSLRELALYGIKGMAAYADHAAILGKTDPAVTACFYKTLRALAEEQSGIESWIALNMEIGKANYRCMEILDAAHTERFGTPEPTRVSLGIRRGPAILVSGHDLEDLEELLKQTQGKDVWIYTHGEMLPAHGYPKLKAYAHLAGNYGGAWQDQAREFDEFPGAVLMTTNCIQEPREAYRGRIFTTGLVAWPGVAHIAKKGGKKDFTPVIAAALKAGGFTEDRSGKSVQTGFGHGAVLGVAGKVVEAVKAGAVRRFFLIGGCDGAKTGRNYYTEFAENVPKDCVILTLACGKYRFYTLDFGDIGDIPRLLDIGQCNDAYSAVRIAVALAGAFGCGVNELPLSLILSWYEQKAVVILLTLLSLGIKGIRIGPSLPAFISPGVLKVLAENFDLKSTASAKEDLSACLATGKAAGAV